MTCPQCGEDNRDSAERCSSCSHSLALPAGTVLAFRYEIKSMLGVGGLGRVYRAHDRMLDEMVAVKVLHPEASRSAEMSKRFRSEIKLARKVRHKNVCAIHEYGEHEDYRFVAMELVDGVDLHRVLRQVRQLPPREAFDVSMQVAKGLAAIHEAGVIHRDLKTPNIMRDARGNVRLLDFGIAKLIAPTDTMAVTAVQKVVGTPEYMSPEQIRGDDLDERSDIYGLGVVIFELFTGKVPFQGKSSLDTLLLHMSTPPPLYGEAASRLVPSLVPVLARCLAKSPSERYASARELLDALRLARNETLPEAGVSPQGADARTTPPPLTPAGTPRSGAWPEPAPSAVRAPVTPLTPPVGPPRKPLPGAPPKLPPREATPALPLPSPDAPMTPAASPPPAAPGSGWGVGLALIGLAATVGASLWLRYKPVASSAPTKPAVVAHATPTVVPHPAATSDRGAAPPEATAASASSTASPAPTTDAPPSSTSTSAESEAATRRRSAPLATAPTPAPTPKPAPATGSLDLAVKPSAEVELDGRDAGPAPLTRQVGAGVRVVRLNHPDYWPVTRRVAVDPGKTLRLDVDLSWEGVQRSRSKEPPFSVPLDGSPSDPYFERGLHQLAQGDFQEAILTLEPVARRLEQAGKEKDLARAEFYLGIAYLELNRQGTAKERFARALELDASMRVPGAVFSPKITSFFATVRETATRKKP